jgi:hypothetical protein
MGQGGMQISAVIGSNFSVNYRSLHNKYHRRAPTVAPLDYRPPPLVRRATGSDRAMAAPGSS